MRESVIARIQASTVVDQNGCWLWQKAKTTGYGVIRITEDGRSHNALTHRVMCEYAHGPIPPGYEVDHLCRNRACCNPEHLEAVTKYENNMRSDSLSALNRRKVYCHRGHLLAGDNLRLRKDGKGRECRACLGCKPKTRQTHCKRGHLLEPPNITITTQGSRQCMACVRLLRGQRKQQAA